MSTQAVAPELARLLDVGAVAAMLGVSGRHVYRLADSGRMPRPIRLGGAVRWDRDTIERWITDGCQAVATSTHRVPRR